MEKQIIDDAVIFQIAAKQDAIMHMLAGIMGKLTDGDANDILTHYKDLARKDATLKYGITKILEDKNINP